MCKFLIDLAEIYAILGYFCGILQVNQHTAKGISANNYLNLLLDNLLMACNVSIYHKGIECCCSEKQIGEQDNLKSSKVMIIWK